MTDIYLNCNSSNLKLAETIKKEIESQSKLSVSIENDDWEDDDGRDFLDSIDWAKDDHHIHKLPSYNHSRMGHRQRGGHNQYSKRQPNMTEALPIEFSTSHNSSGMQKLMSLLRQVPANKVIMAWARRPLLSKVLRKRRKDSSFVSSAGSMRPGMVRQARTRA